MSKEIFEKIYEKPDAVWTKTEPPRELVELIEKGKIKPSKVIDIGCGEGFYSIYLASKGFDVLGIDFSEKAIQYAKKNAASRGANIRFMAIDIADLEKLKEKFDFIFEWGILHHIMPPQRQKYVKDLAKLLNKNGKYLSACFNEESLEFGGPGKGYRMSPLGIEIYYSSQSELKELFELNFCIIEAKIITIVGRLGQKHIGNYFLMEKNMEEEKNNQNKKEKKEKKEEDCPLCQISEETLERLKKAKRIGEEARKE